ncbi:hypothetical protein ACIBBG_29015, partial [Micromonospora chersina]|uniref:hypothetical protein n=1 Tax=Micromonospora chersina TaxID=47854 RepID=UPI0037B073DE
MTTVLPDAALSPYAAGLLRVATVPEAAADDPTPGRVVDAARLSDRELGVLLAAAHRLLPVDPAYWVKLGVTAACQQRQPVFTPESCAALLSALVDELAQPWGQGNPVLAVNALLRCEGVCKKNGVTPDQGAAPDDRDDDGRGYFRGGEE